MNVNDVICVGAEPIAMLDFILTRARRPGDLRRSSASAWRAGAELAGIEIPGGEIAQVGDIVSGQELGGTCVGLVALDAIVTGAGVEPGDPVIGLPSSGLHSNGYTLARAALADVPLDDDRLGRPLGDVLLEPTEIYVRPILELLRSAVDGPRPRPHHRRRPRQPAAARGRGRLRDRRSAAGAAGLRADPGARRGVRRARCTRCSTWAAGSAAWSRADDEGAALELLQRHYPDAKRIGRATDRPGEVSAGS